ncbi:MAG: Fur family transcriptional regulator [Acidimicrobiia bacterium]|nr:Fur family transcriptional regulator [Acidimicrobiia bacterium]
MTANPVTDIQREIRQHLNDRDIRYTTGRRAVIKALQRAGGPRSAAELRARLRSVPLSSLYRSLAVHEGAGILRKHHDADGLARFELAEWLGGHQHHLVCSDGGLMEDVELGEESELALDQLAARIANSQNYQLAGHVIEVEGICPGCRS